MLHLSLLSSRASNLRVSCQENIQGVEKSGDRLMCLEFWLHGWTVCSTPGSFIRHASAHLLSSFNQHLEIMTKCYYRILLISTMFPQRIPRFFNLAIPLQGQGREPSVTLWDRWLVHLECFFACPYSKPPFLQNPSRLRQILGSLSFWLNNIHPMKPKPNIPVLVWLP